MLNTEKFTGKALAYAKARPGYPDEAIDYICALAPQGAVFADIGAGTGKFAEPLAARGYKLFAVEPNADMREQLTLALAPFPNAKVVVGAAEATTLADKCADVITCAQALHWFDPDKFRKECLRIGKPNVLAIAVYNYAPGGASVSLGKESTDVFFKNPAVKEFPNPVLFSKESFIQYMTSHSHDPLPQDPEYDAHITEINAIFDRENTDGLLRRDTVTKVYSEIII